jgi:hypothetical protein
MSGEDSSSTKTASIRNSGLLPQHVIRLRIGYWQSVFWLSSMWRGTIFSTTMISLSASADRRRYENTCWIMGGTFCLTRRIAC